MPADPSPALDAAGLEALVTALRDPDYAGVMQHCRNWTEIDRLFNRAADVIEQMSASSLVIKANAVEEVRQTIFAQWEDHAASLAATGLVSRAEVVKECAEVARALTDEAKSGPCMVTARRIERDIRALAPSADPPREPNAT